MPADIYSSFLGLLLMGTGNNDNTWGDLHNDNVTKIVERSIAGANVQSVTGGALNLATVTPPTGVSSAVDHIQAQVGTLTSALTITVPNVSKTWLFLNVTTGDFPVLVKTASGTAVNVPRGRPVTMWCDGSNRIYRGDRTEVGRIDHFAMDTPPTDTLLCNGAIKNVADYPDLFAAIGATYGGNGTTTFGLPDTYAAGRFLRSKTATLPVGTQQSELLPSHTHTASASHSLAFAATSSDNGSHAHTGGGTTGSGGVHKHVGATAHYTGAAGGGSAILGGAVSVTNAISGFETTDAAAHDHSFSFTTSTVPAHSHTVSGTVTGSITVTVNAAGGAELRPVCLAVTMCIRY